MKQSDFKQNLIKNLGQALKIRIMLIKTSIIYSFQENTAFVSQNWSNMASTFFYTISFILFIKVLYSNIETFADYSENEVLFLLMIGQISFYTNWILIQKNLSEISNLVNTGSLDTILTKPVPADFYLSFKKISLINVFRDALMPIVAIAISINWAKIDISIYSLYTGIGVWTLGMVAHYSISFISRLPVFWIGKGVGPAELVMQISNYLQGEIPWEGLTDQLKFIFVLIIPLAIDVALATSVILNKSNAVQMLIISFIVAILFSILRKLIWKRALMRYSSASS